jgi:hypothetical protein
MGWWFAQRNSPLVELANTTSSVKGSTKRGIIVRARTASPSVWGLSTLSEKRCALRFKASAVAMYSLFRQEEDAP